MKLSKYNLWTLLPQGLVVYNTLTGALTVFDHPNGALVKDALERKDPEKIPKKFRKSMFDDGLLIDDDFDELSTVRTRGLIGRTQNELILSIMLTMACNFDCEYCFQLKGRGAMSAEVEKKVLDYVANQAQKKERISIDWYGGEPLLRKAQLVRMNDRVAEICRKNKTDYSISITTNGYGLDANMISYLKQFQVSHLQITLDGPPETHDKSRPLLGGKPTFDRILGNIRNAVEANLPVSLRINIWKKNEDQVLSLYDVLDNHGLKNRVNVLIKPVISSQAKPCEEDCLDSSAACARILSVYAEAAKRGWIVLPYAENLQSHEFCIVDSVGQFIIDPSGYVYKCGEIFDKSETVGRLTKNGEITLDEARWSKWISKQPTEFEECRSCEFLPMCMGGCSMKRFWKPNLSPCWEFKHSKDKFLEVLLANACNTE